MVTNTPPTPLSPRVTALLRESGITQDVIGQHLGLTRVAVSDRMTGRTRYTAEELPAIASMLSMTLAELVGTIEADQ